MNHKNIENKFESIPIGSRTKTSFKIYPLFGPLWISRSQDKLPRLIFILDKTGAQSDDDSIGKIHYQVIPNAKIWIGGRASTKPICILEVNDLKYCTQFFCFIETILYEKHIRSLNTQQKVKEYIKKWEELFSSDKVLSLSEQIGLWGELHFINKFKCADKVVEKWHGPENKKFDFFTTVEGIDVKTSINSSVHHFSLGQVQAPHSAIIFSLQIIEDPNGYSLEEQIAIAKSKLKSKASFLQKLIKTNIYQAPIVKSRYSIISERLLNAKYIPQPRRIDPGVEELHFKCDVSAARPVSAKTVSAIYKRLLH